MDAWEPVVHALSHRDDATSESEARAAAERWRAGRPRGPLDGVPVTIKENIASGGVPTPLGTAAAELVPAVADAPVVARLREAGAVIVAKTTMPDYGMLTSGVSSLHPTTRNPWNPAWTPGGSSAGAAAAAAAGYGPIHIGTDIGGSVRLPGCWTGVVGFKPSFGRVPVAPPYYGRVAGPLTRTVADAARAMAVISAADDRDHMSLPPQPLQWDELAGEVSGLRIGLVRSA
jgi:aspartyl-tRNA(Asn)/glutamyl-tRNA(Gln) amidotransferase subunit A